MKKVTNSKKIFQFPENETLMVEFKSDRKGLSDDELVESVVCLADSDGGSLYLGLEDNGSLTGIAHHSDPLGIISLIGNKTVPPLLVQDKMYNIS